MLQVKYNDNILVVAVEDAKPSFTLSQLLIDTAYNISVSAINSAGDGSYSNIITTNTLSTSRFIVCTHYAHTHTYTYTSCT